MAVAQSDPNVVYAGTGEPDIRGNFSHGDGVYKSTDAGKTWKRVGLFDSRQIGRIAIHPTNPDVVYVAALGHVFGPNIQRGVFRSTDGGATWKRVHFVNEDTGAVDIALDPFNPRIVYAGFWQVRRKPWRLDSGGEGSGLWRSKDGGDTWEKLKKGLPKGVLGKIGVSPSAARQDRVFAIVEAEDGGVFRSDDGGDNWSRVNQERKLRQRAWYYSRIQADPQAADTVYVLNVRFHKSIDGGKSFKAIPTPHVDNHALWIDPDDNQRMIEGNDGGANVSIDGGQTWSRQDNQPTAQFYHVATDNRFPYRVLGAQQDNSTMSIAHTSHALNGRDFYAVGGGESGYIAARPDDPDVIYAGSYAGWLTRYDHKTGLARPISPWPENPIGGGAAELKHRFQWTFPIVISPHDPDVVYVGGEVLFKTTNGGQSFEVISPDLTTNDKQKQASSGGPITQDNTTVEYYCTIFSVAESPLKRGRIWVGTDDGLVHVTDDEGKNWEKVTPKGLGKNALISLVEASPHDADVAYLAVNRYKSDDFRPYVVRTRDRGATWEPVVKGIGKEAFVRAVREDPERRDMLFAGTETGVYVSFDAGANWQSLQLDLPVVPITDLVVKGDDLVVSTQGRSFWILSGLSRLRQVGAVAPKGAYLCKPAPAYRALRGSARIHFNLPPDFDGASLSFVDARGRTMNAFELVPEKDDDGRNDKKTGASEEEDDDDVPSSKIRAKSGMNVYMWNMRRKAPTKVPGAVGWPRLRNGPMVLPGTYTVTLKIGEGSSVKGTLEVRRDPRLEISDEDIAASSAYIDDVYETLDRVHKAINTIRDVRRQIGATMRRARNAQAAKKLKPSADELKKALQAIEDALIQTKSKSPQDPLNYPVKLNDKLTMLLGQTHRDLRPTDSAKAVLASLKERVKVQLDELDAVLAKMVTAFNEAAKGVPAVVVKDD